MENIFQIRKEIDAGDLFDNISRCLQQASSMAMFVRDDNFSTYSDDIVGNFGWAISNKIEELEMLITELWEKIRPPHSEVIQH